MSCFNFTLKSFSDRGCQPSLLSDDQLLVQSKFRIQTFSTRQSSGCFSNVGGTCEFKLCAEDLAQDSTISVTLKRSAAGLNNLLREDSTFPFLLQDDDKESLESTEDCGANEFCDCEASVRVMNCSGAAACENTATFNVSSIFEDVEDVTNIPVTISPTGSGALNDGNKGNVLMIAVVAGGFALLAVSIMAAMLRRRQSRSKRSLSEFPVFGSKSQNDGPQPITIHMWTTPEGVIPPKPIMVKSPGVKLPPNGVSKAGPMPGLLVDRKGGPNSINQFLRYFDDNSTVASKRLSLETDVDNFDVKSYKSRMTGKEDKRIIEMRKQSARLSENMSKINLLLGFGNARNSVLTMQTSAPKKSAKDLVKDVYESLKEDIISEEDLDFAGNIDNVIEAPKVVPKVLLEHYLFRLVTGLNRWFYEDEKTEVAGIRSLILSLVYLEKIKEVKEDFQLTVLNVHRLFAIMMLVAAKFSEDEPILNGYWAEISGIELDEMNTLEDDFCFKSGFDFFVKPSELATMYEKYKFSYLDDQVGNFRNSLDSFTTRGV